MHEDEVGAFMARLVGIFSAVPEAWGSSSVRGKGDTPLMRDEVMSWPLHAHFSAPRRDTPG